MASGEYPRSVNVGRSESKEYWITAASWDTGYGPSFEIGIRRKDDRDFTLIQAGWDEETVKMAMNAVAILLDHGISPSAIREVFP